MPHTDNDLQYLTLEEIRVQLEEFTIDQLRAFADRTEVRDYAGAVPNPRTRGVMWPPDAVPLLAHLVAARVAGKLEPKNAKAYLSDLVSIANGERDSPTRSIGQPPRSPDGSTDGALVRRNGAGIGQSPEPPDRQEIAEVQGRAQGLAMADCAFDALGAAEFLCCSVRLLRRHVPASFRLGSSQAGDRWYRRDLLGLNGLAESGPALKGDR